MRTKIAEELMLRHDTSIHAKNPTMTYSHYPHALLTTLQYH